MTKLISHILFTYLLHIYLLCIGMDKYGLIAQAVGGSTAQVEKVDHATAVKLLSSLGIMEYYCQFFLLGKITD